MKSQLKLFGILILIGIAIIAGLAWYDAVRNQDVNVTINSEREVIKALPASSKQLTFNDFALADMTNYNNVTNEIHSNNLNMYVDIFPAVAGTVTGENIRIDNLTFTWKGQNAQNISALFVYDDALESMKFNLYRNVSYIDYEWVTTNKWVSNYLVNGVVSYTNLGTPDSRCQNGNTNNTKMYQVTLSPYNSTYYYCFTNITTVNATAFRISGNYDDTNLVGTPATKYAKVDVTDKIEDITQQTASFLKGNKTIYYVENTEFQAGESKTMEWVFTPKDHTRKGKWSILLYNPAEGLYNSLANGHYLYIDPWYDNNYFKKIPIYVNDTLNTPINRTSEPFYKKGITVDYINNCTREGLLTDGTETVEIASYAKHINNTYCELTFIVNKSASANQTYYFYYNTSNTQRDYSAAWFTASTSAVTNLNYNASLWANIGSGTSGNDYFNISGVNLFGNTSHKAGKLAGTWDEVQAYTITVREDNPLYKKVEWSGGSKRLNVTFFRGVDYYMIEDIAGYSTSNSGMSMYAATGAGISKQVTWRSGTENYTTRQNITDNNAPIVYNYLQMIDYSRQFDGNGLFWYINNQSTLSWAAYTRTGDANDWQGSLFASGNYYTMSGNMNVYDNGNYWSGIVAKNNVERERLWNQFTTPLTYTTGTIQSNSNTTTYATFSAYNTNPANATTYVAGATYRFNITISDPVNPVDYANANIDGVNKTLTSSNGNYTFTMTDLAAGQHTIIWYANNSINSWNSTTTYYTIVKANSTATLTTTPASPITYGTASTFSCSLSPSLAGLNFYVNGVDASAQNGVSLTRSAGSYLANCTYAGNTNYSASEQSATYTISQIPSNITLYLNGTQGNLSMPYPSQVNASANATFGTAKLYRNGTDVTSLNNAFEDLGVGYYNFTAVTIGDLNHSNRTVTFFANITKGTPALTMGITPSSTVTVGTGTVATGSGCPSQVTCNLFRNDTVGTMSNPDVQTLGVGSYLYTYNTTGNSNYSVGSASATLVVTSAPLIIPQYSNPSNNPASPQTYTSGASYQLNIDWINASNVKLEFNGANYTGSNVAGNTYRVTLTDLPAGTYAYKWWANSTDGSANMTSSANYVINKATPVGSIACTPSYTVTYPTETTCTATETNVRDSDVTYNFYMDNALSANPNVTNLSVATHTALYNTTGGQNYSAATLDTKTITVINASLTELSSTFNATTYETADESYNLNMSFDTAVYTLQSATMYYNGTALTSTSSSYSGGAVISNSKTLAALTTPQNYSFYWTLSLINTNGSTLTYTTSTKYQYVNVTQFGLCNSTLNQKYFNFTFRNETINQEYVSASIISTFVYYLGSGSVNKTYYYSNANTNMSYAFCASPSDRSFYAQPYIQYQNPYSTARVYNPSIAYYPVTSQTTVLSILPSGLGIYSRYVSYTSGGGPLSSVSVQITRNVGGTTVNIANGLTDASGLFAIYLDPTAQYDYVFSKAGYLSKTFSLTPNSNEPYAVYLALINGGATQINGSQIGTNKSVVITPSNSSLLNNTNYIFSLNVTGNVNFIAFNITNLSGQQIAYVSGSSGYISTTINTGNYSRLTGTFTIRSSTENYSFSKTWLITNYYVGSHSLFAVMTSWDQYGFAYDYYRFIIIVLVMIVAVGGLSKMEITDTSESKIGTGIFILWAFSYVNWLNIGIAAINPSAPFYVVQQFANQFGIAIVTTIIGLFAIAKEWIT